MLPKYHSYLLRLWQAGPADNPTWRASLEDPHTHQVIGFDTIEALCTYLNTLDAQTITPPSKLNQTQHHSVS
jgi:hypothetical protein